MNKTIKSILGWTLRTIIVMVLFITACLVLIKIKITNENKVSNFVPTVMPIAESMTDDFHFCKTVIMNGEDGEEHVRMYIYILPEE